jgi:phosphatidylserine decarboxylase
LGGERGSFERMTIAREGYPLILAAAVATVAAFALGWWVIGWVLGVLAVAIAAFFRDPRRRIPSEDGLVVSPADGKVVSVADVIDDPLFADAVTRVSIFLSPLDVHINRIPVTGTIEEIRYKPGKFLAAYKEEASRDNEQNVLKMVDEKGRSLGVVQIAGVLARRIVCRIKRGDALERGQRFGLIMFGSRTDTYLPRGCRVEVREGDRVKGGESVLGRFV